MRRKTLFCFLYRFRFATVQADGRYVTDIDNDGARFSVMIAALIGARISLSVQAIATMKVR